MDAWEPQLSAGALQDDDAGRRMVLMRPTLALTSTALSFGRSGEHTRIVPPAAAPAAENPLGRKVNLLAAAASFALDLTTSFGCSTVSRRTVVTPFFVTNATQ